MSQIFAPNEESRAMIERIFGTNAPASDGQNGPVEAAPSSSNGHSDIASVWAEHADYLGPWAEKRLVNRADRWGGIQRKAGKPGWYKATGKLTVNRLARHFKGADPTDVIGVYSTAPDPDEVCWSLWLGLDFDHHGEGPAPDSTWNAALSCFEVLTKLRFRPILEDSNGRGGFHVWVLFAERVQTTGVRAFGLWLVRGWKTWGLDSQPEVFPKQDRITPKDCGNLLRLPGRHFKNLDHWSRIWDGSRWLEGEDAIGYLVNTTGDDPALIPKEAVEFKASKPKGRPKAGSGSSRSLEALKAQLAELDPKLGQESVGWSVKQMSDGKGILVGRCPFEHDSGTSNDGDLSAGFHDDGPYIKCFHESCTSIPEINRKLWARADDREVIEVTCRRNIVAAQTVKTLAKDLDLYCRGGSLGIVVEEENSAVKLAGGVELGNAKGAGRFLVLSRPRVGCCLAKNAAFYRWSKDKSGEDVCKEIDPPAWLIEAVETWGHWPGMRKLLGIASAPWVKFVEPPASRFFEASLPDPGFDSETGTLYHPTVKLGPYRKGLEGVEPFDGADTIQGDAVAAAGRLANLVRQFPFARGLDFAVWLAALLTGIQRPAIAGPVPGFAFNGNKAGTGKGLLIDLVGLIVWGHTIPTRSYPFDPKEMAKVKLSLALAGVSAVHFDNLPEGGWYGGGELDSALTSMLVEGRILGVSRESGPVPLRPVWFLSGNNISPGKDSYRRWLPCNLATELESPHERDDIEVPTLRQYVLEHRGELLRDALVILETHARAGRPVHWKAPLGSFEEWDRIVRGAVWWATWGDCLESQRVATADSPERLEKLALLTAWDEHQQHFLPRGMTCAEVLEAVRPAKPDEPSPYPEFYAVLAGLSRNGKLPTARELGDKIRGMQGQIIEGRKFVKGDEWKHSTVWRVVGT